MTLARAVEMGINPHPHNQRKAEMSGEGRGGRDGGVEEGISGGKHC